MPPHNRKENKAFSQDDEKGECEKPTKEGGRALKRVNSLSRERARCETCANVTSRGEGEYETQSGYKRPISRWIDPGDPEKKGNTRGGLPLY